MAHFKLSDFTDSPVPYIHPQCVHYSGGIRYRMTTAATATMSRGYPACCSGDRAIAISRREGAQSADRTLVNCKRCVALFVKEIP